MGGRSRANRQDLYPKDPEEIKNAFALAREYFAKHKDINKIRRKDFQKLGMQNLPNSFIKDNHGNIYMLASSRNRGLSRAAYLGRGSFADVKRAMSEKGIEYAVRIAYVDMLPFQKKTNETGMAETAGLVKGHLLRSSASKKSLGMRGGEAGAAEFQRGFSKGILSSRKKEYQVQPLLEVTLRDYLIEHKASLSLEKRFLLAMQILLMVDELHTLGIAHLDLKPANIMLNGNEVVLVDFGFASAIHKNSDLKRGTPAYRPLQKENLADRMRSYFFHDSNTALDIYGLLKIMFHEAYQNSSLFTKEECLKNPWMKDIFLTESFTKFKTVIDLAVAMISGMHRVRIEAASPIEMHIFISWYVHHLPLFSWDAKETQFFMSAPHVKIISLDKLVDPEFLALRTKIIGRINQAFLDIQVNRHSGSDKIFLAHEISFSDMICSESLVFRNLFRKISAAKDIDDVKKILENVNLKHATLFFGDERRVQQLLQDVQEMLDADKPESQKSLSKSHDS